jgi:hypothetical protein
MHIDSFMNSATYLLTNNCLYFIPIICSFFNPPQYMEYIKKIIYIWDIMLINKIVGIIKIVNKNVVLHTQNILTLNIFYLWLQRIKMNMHLWQLYNYSWDVDKVYFKEIVWFLYWCFVCLSHVGRGTTS